MAQRQKHSEWIGMSMGHGASDDWPEEYIIVVPHSWRDDHLWLDIQVETQERIGTTLREMYADLEQLPLSPSLILLIRQIEAGRSAPDAHG
jgi:hypothetical protein